MKHNNVTKSVSALEKLYVSYNVISLELALAFTLLLHKSVPYFCVIMYPIQFPIQVFSREIFSSLRAQCVLHLPTLVHFLTVNFHFFMCMLVNNLSGLKHRKVYPVWTSYCSSRTTLCLTGESSVQFNSFLCNLMLTKHNPAKRWMYSFGGCFWAVVCVNFPFHLVTTKFQAAVHPAEKQ